MAQTCSKETIDAELATINERTRKRIYKQYQKGKTIQMISTQYGVERNTISEVIKIMKNEKTKKNIIKNSKVKKDKNPDYIVAPNIVSEDASDKNIQYSEKEKEYVREYIEEQNARASEGNRINIPKEVYEAIESDSKEEDNVMEEAIEDVKEDVVEEEPIDDAIEKFKALKKVNPLAAMPSDVLNQLIEDYKNGMHINDLSSKYVTTRNAIYKIIARHGITRRTSPSIKADTKVSAPIKTKTYVGTSADINIILNNLDDILADLNNGILNKNLAVKYGIGYKNFCRIMHKIKLEISSGTSIEDIKKKYNNSIFIHKREADETIKDESNDAIEEDSNEIINEESEENTEISKEESIDYAAEKEYSAYDDVVEYEPNKPSICPVYSSKDFSEYAFNMMPDFVSVENIRLGRLHEPKTVSAGMIINRHPFPVNKYIIDKDINSDLYNLNMFIAYTKKFIRNNIKFVNGEAQQYLTVYITGLSQCMTSIIKTCLEEGVNLKMMFYKQILETTHYKGQYVIKQFGSMANNLDIMDRTGNDGAIYVDFNNFNIDNFIRLKIRRKYGDIVNILSSDMKTILELKEYLKDSSIEYHTIVTTQACGTQYYKI